MKSKLVAVGYKKYVFCLTVIFTGFLITKFNSQNERRELRRMTYVTLSFRAKLQSADWQ
jgi:hypothetical protein